MKLSLILPVHQETSLEARAREIVSFWAKFPVDLEVIFVVDPSSDFDLPKSEADLQALLPPARIRFRILSNARHLGRGASVQRGLSEAEGEILAVGSYDLSIPLGEIFTALHEFIQSRDQSFILVGNRRGAKKKRGGMKSGKRKIFEDIEHEKSRGLEVKDPTCPFWMIKKKDWEALGIRKMRRWFYTPPVLLAARRTGLEIREIELNCRDNPQSKMRFWDALR